MAKEDPDEARRNRPDARRHRGGRDRHRTGDAGRRQSPYLGEDPFQSGCVAGSVAAPTSESPDGHLRMTDPRSNTYVGDAQLLHTPKCAGFWMLVVFNPQYRVDPAMSVEGVVDPALVGPSSLAPGNGAVWSFVLRGMERDNACADVGVTNQNGQHVATFNLGCTGQPPRRPVERVLKHILIRLLSNCSNTPYAACIERPLKRQGGHMSADEADQPVTWTTEETTEERTTRHRRHSYVLAGVVATAGVVGFVLTVATGRTDSAMLFVGLPTLLALAVVLSPPARSVHGMTFKGITVGLLIAAVLLHEGPSACCSPPHSSTGWATWSRPSSRGMSGATSRSCRWPCCSAPRAWCPRGGPNPSRRCRSRTPSPRRPPRWPNASPPAPGSPPRRGRSC
ncbi:hypothetical protein ACFQX7_07865 [Luedemannella flava]